MRKYLVSFYYYTDLRDQKGVIARDSIHAIIKAMDMANIAEEWVTSEGFRIEIELYD